MNKGDSESRMDFYDLIPKNKYDISNIEKLKQLTTKEIEPILPALLEWIQDRNWPVAEALLPVLALHQSALTPLIMNILSPKEEDNIWKYYIITCLLPLFSDACIAPLLPSLKRIAENPTQNEILEETNSAAFAFLQDRT